MIQDPRVSGVVSPELLRALGYLPGDSRLRRGPVAIFECIEPIPCNVCVFVCPFKAVKMDKITDLPQVDFDKCSGCTVCVGRCPGQAIFVVDMTSEGEFGSVTMQYDLRDPPKKGESVTLLDREGKEVGVGEVLLVYKEKVTGSHVVKVKVPKELVMVVRAIKPRGGADG